jgi:hypothetical protein
LASSTRPEGGKEEGEKREEGEGRRERGGRREEGEKREEGGGRREGGRERRERREEGGKGNNSICTYASATYHRGREGGRGKGIKGQRKGR